MSALAHLIADVEGSIAHASGDDRARALSRITDLLVRDPGALNDEQVELFDAVIHRFAIATEAPVRAELAARIANLPNGPKSTLLALASAEEIEVAEPILASATPLPDGELARIALERGRDHMLAMSRRPALSETVTDVLVTNGDGTVRQAVAGNHSARFSLSGTAALLDLARADETLQELLGERDDLSGAQLNLLVEIAKESARTRLIAALPDSGGRRPPALPGPRRDFSHALAALASIRESRPVTEADLAGFAEGGRVEETICALAELAHLPLVRVEQVFDDRQSDLLIVIGRARNWPWRIVRTLLRLRDPSLSERHALRRAEDVFNGLALATAGRVLQVMRTQDGTFGQSA
jgi:uncharacterized protein (DUF2336 family)